MKVILVLALALCGIAEIQNAQAAEDKNLDRYLNTLGVLFHPSPNPSPIEADSNFSTLINVSGIPKVTSPIAEGLEQDCQSPILGIPYLQVYGVSNDSRGVYYGGKGHLGGLLLKGETVTCVEDFSHLHRAAGMEAFVGYNFGKYMLHLPFIYQYSESETQGALVDVLLKSRVFLNSRIWATGLVFGQPDVFSLNFLLLDRDSRVRMKLSPKSPSVVASSRSEPNRFRRLFSAGMSFNLTRSVKIEISQLVSPGNIAVPRFSVSQSFKF